MPESVDLFLFFLLSKTEKSRNSQLTKLQVKVLPTHDASKVRASGSGLKTTGVPSSLPVKFNIDGKDAGPRREAQEANICDNHDGTYLVSYVPDMTDSCSVHPDSSPYATLNSNICQLCIQLEAFACCAEALGRDFRPLLTTWLYPVLEKAAEADLDAVCEACLPYLRSRQPIRLQEACLSVFRHLIQVGPDTFWFTLNELHCPSSYIPHHPDLLLNGTGRPRDEFSDNVFKLLKEEFGSVTETVNQPVS
ncbi:unnamed protein product [Oreochromis niloticus]|nr:unnamed protein product [Mustela putorius furo]